MLPTKLPPGVAAGACVLIWFASPGGAERVAGKNASAANRRSDGSFSIEIVPLPFVAVRVHRQNEYRRLFSDGACKTWPQGNALKIAIRQKTTNPCLAYDTLISDTLFPKPQLCPPCSGGQTTTNSDCKIICTTIPSKSCKKIVNKLAAVAM